MAQRKNEAPRVFWDVAHQVGALKGGLLGFNKSGKTVTGSLLACAAREVLGLKGPIGFYDTETGSMYVRDLILKLTGLEPLIKRSRSFEDLLRWGHQCVEEGAAAGICDSITHPWRELCDSYLTELNAARAVRRWSQQKKLEFQDWNVIKPKWGQWTDFYLNSPISIVICGRAGWEYEMTKNEETEKKELNKVGIKMKTEGEFGFEPSLLIQMEAEQELKQGSPVPTIIRRATVLGDRFSVIDGQSTTFASFNSQKMAEVKQAYKAVLDFFRPHLSLLVSGAHPTVDLTSKTEFGLGEDGSTSWQEEKRQRVILCEEIQGLFVSHIPGQAAADKKKKADLLEEFFRTRSWTAVEGLRSSVLRDGLLKLRGKLAPGSVPAQAAQPQDPDVDFGDPAAKNAPDSTSLTDQPPPEEPAGEGEAQA